MFQSIIYRALVLALRLVGKQYTPSHEIPPGLIISTFIQRGFWLLHGLLRLRKQVFIASNVSLRGVSRDYIGRYVTFEHDCKIDGYAQNGVSIGELTKIGPYVEISCTSHLSRLGKGLTLGKRCGVGAYSFFGASGGIAIGDDVIMGQWVSFHAQEHKFDNLSILIREQGVIEQGIRIGNDCWIGAKVTILDGSRIGNHCVIAAGAVVKGEFPDNTVIGGVPAKIIRKIEKVS